LPRLKKEKVPGLELSDGGTDLHARETAREVAVMGYEHAGWYSTSISDSHQPEGIKMAKTFSVELSMREAPGDQVSLLGQPLAPPQP
jgi:hypothetical protein